MHTICLIAMSSDFFEIVLPNPVPSEAVFVDFTGLRVDCSEMCEVLRYSCASAVCPLAGVRLLPGGSVSLPLVTTGDECLLGIFTDPVASGLLFIVRAAPGRDLPADTGRSGKVVLRFGGVSRGKSGGTIGCCDRTRGLGELGRDAGP